MSSLSGFEGESLQTDAVLHRGLLGIGVSLGTRKADGDAIGWLVVAPACQVPMLLLPNLRVRLHRRSVPSRLGSSLWILSFREIIAPHAHGVYKAV